MPATSSFKEWALDDGFKHWAKKGLFAQKRKQAAALLAAMTPQEQEAAWNRVWAKKKDSYRAHLEGQKAKQGEAMDRAGRMGPVLKQAVVKTVKDVPKVIIGLPKTVAGAAKDVAQFGVGQASLGMSNLFGALGNVQPSAGRAEAVEKPLKTQRETFKNALGQSLGVTYGREVGEPRHITALRGLVARGKATPAQRTELDQFDRGQRGATITGLGMGIAPQLAAPAVGGLRGLGVGALQTGAGVAIRRMTDKPGPKTAEEMEERRLFDLLDAVGNMGPLALIEGGKAIYRVGGAVKGIAKSRKAAKVIAKPAIAATGEATALADAATEVVEETVPKGKPLARATPKPAAPEPPPRNLANAPDAVHAIRAKYAGVAQEGVDQVPTVPPEGGLDDLSPAFPPKGSKTFDELRAGANSQATITPEEKLIGEEIEGAAGRPTGRVEDVANADRLARSEALNAGKRLTPVGAEGVVVVEGDAALPVRVSDRAADDPELLRAAALWNGQKTAAGSRTTRGQILHARLKDAGIWQRFDPPDEKSMAQFMDSAEGRDALESVRMALPPTERTRFFDEATGAMLPQSRVDIEEALLHELFGDQDTVFKLSQSRSFNKTLLDNVGSMASLKSSPAGPPFMKALRTAIMEGDNATVPVGQLAAGSLFGDATDDLTNNFLTLFYRLRERPAKLRAVLKDLRAIRFPDARHATNLFGESAEELSQEAMDILAARLKAQIAGLDAKATGETKALFANPPSAIVRVGQGVSGVYSGLNAVQALGAETPEERRAAALRAALFGGLAVSPAVSRMGAKAIARTGAKASLGRAAGLALDAWESGAPEAVKRSAQGAVARMKDAGTIAGGVKRGVEGALADSAGSVGQTMRQVLMKKPEGRALVRPIEDVREYGDILAFRDMQDLAPKLDALKRANRQEYDDFWQYVEAGQAPASPEGQAAFYSWQRIHNALADAAEELGVEVEGDAFKRVQNYFPRQILPKVRVQITGRRGPVFEAVQAWALQNRGQKWWQEFEAQLKHAVTVNPETYFTAHRIADLPPVIEWDGQIIKLMETDPTKVFTRHVRRANHRLAAYDLLGQDVAGNRWTFEVRMRPPMVTEKAPGMADVQSTSMTAQRPQRDVVLYRETNWQAAEAMRDEALRVAGPDASVYVFKRRIHPWNSPEGVINGKLAAAQGAFDSGTGVFSDRLRLLVGRELGAIPEPPGSPILQTVRNLETAVKLPLAVLSNSLQTLQTTVPAFGVKATGRAVLDRAALGARDTLKRFEPVFKKFPAAKGVYDAALGFAEGHAKRGEMQLRTVLATGLHLDDYSNITETLMDAAEGSGTSGWLAGQVLQKSGFEWAERNNRLIAGFAAMNSYADMARTLKNGQRPVLTALREGAGVNPAELARIMFERAGFAPQEVAEIAQRGYLTPREMTKAIRHGVEDTQFMGLTTLDTPTAFNNEVLKTLFQFKRFGARYAAFSLQLARDAWKTKDPTLALKLLAGGVIGGGIIRDQIMQQLNARRDSENEWTDYLAKMVWYSGMLGPVVDMVTGRKAGDIQSAMLGPAFGDVFKLGELAASRFPGGLGFKSRLEGMTAGKALMETGKSLSPALRVPIRQWEAATHPEEATLNASGYMFRDAAAERQATASEAQKANAKDELWRAAMRTNEQARMEEMLTHAGRLAEAIGDDPAELEDALLREIDARNPLQPLAAENRAWAAARASGGRMDRLALEGVAAHGKVTAQYLTALVGMGALSEQSAQSKVDRMQQRMAEQLRQAQEGGATPEELTALQELYEAWGQGFTQGMSGGGE